jgi:diguanylate cyclase (GGDEF)-like protein
VIGRLGGEEFAAILPGDLGVGCTAAERVRVAFANMTLDVGGVAVSATVSIGAASEHVLPCDVITLLARADAALYRSKRAGRNCVTADHSTPLPAAPSPPLSPAAAPRERRAEDVALEVA